MYYVMFYLNKYIYLVTLVSVALIAIFARTYRMKFGSDSTTTYLAIIGVLSARGNFEQRQIIRETWLQEISSTPRILVKFVVGYEDCLIPPQYRVDEYQCVQEKLWQNIDLAYKFPILTTNQHLHFHEFGNFYELVATDFDVTKSVVINSLALPCGCHSSDRNKKILVELRDLGNENALVASSIFQSDVGESENANCIKYQKIPPHLLPKGFQGSLVVHCPVHQNNYSCIGVKFHSSNFIHPGVTFRSGVRYSLSGDDFPTRFLPQPPQNSYLPALFQYYIHDPGDLSLHYQNLSNTFQAWKNHTQQIERKLREEINTYSDLIVVGNAGQRFIDTYRSLPEKLLLFYSWSSENLSFNFIGKVDDDCFVDLQKIEKILTSQSESAENLSWIGNFRYDIPVDRWGKWADYHYTSSLYPAFACGSGNLISRPVAKWLTRNHDVLFKYQGEDVCMGIWLSVIHPTLTQNPHFICDDKCEQDMVVTSQHNSSAIKRMWGNKLECGNPCGCE